MNQRRTTLSFLNEWNSGWMSSKRTLTYIEDRFLSLPVEEVTQNSLIWACIKYKAPSLLDKTLINSYPTVRARNKVKVSVNATKTCAKPITPTLKTHRASLTHQTSIKWLALNLKLIEMLKRMYRITLNKCSGTFIQRRIKALLMMMLSQKSLLPTKKTSTIRCIATMMSGLFTLSGSLIIYS